MRTFQALYAQELAAAVQANREGDAMQARIHADRAEEWRKLDEDAVRRARTGATGRHRA